MSKSDQGFKPVVELLEITPEFAEYLIERPSKNRMLSHIRINKMVGDMNKNNWQDWMSMIILGHNEAVIDGQHRLAAIVKSGIPQKFVVQQNALLGTSALSHIVDHGSARGMGILLGCTSREAAVSNTITLASLDWRFTTSISNVRDTLEIMRPFIEDLHEMCGQAAKGLTGAGVRAAFVCFMAIDPEDSLEIADHYRSLVENNSSHKSIQKLVQRLLARGWNADRMGQCTEMFLTMRAMENLKQIPRLANEKTMKSTTTKLACQALEKAHIKALAAGRVKS